MRQHPRVYRLLMLATIVLLMASSRTTASQLVPMQVPPAPELTPSELEGQLMGPSTLLPIGGDWTVWTGETPVWPAQGLSGIGPAFPPVAPVAKDDAASASSWSSLPLAIRRGWIPSNANVSIRGPQSPPAVVRAANGFSITATAVTAQAISVVDFAYPTGSQVMPHFAASAGTKLEWLVDIAVTNSVSGTGWVYFVLDIDFGSGFDVRLEGDPMALPAADRNKPGSNDVVISRPSNSSLPTYVYWKWQQQGSKFSAGSVAHLMLRVTAESLVPSAVPWSLCGNATLTYGPGGEPTSFKLAPIHVSTGGDCATVSLSATEISWTVLKPGVYAVCGAEISVSGNQALNVQFTEFGDLMPLEDCGSYIPVFYSFERELPDVDSPAWIPARGIADALDRRVPKSLGSTSRTCMWIKIHVDESTLSAEYENKGVIVFTVANNLINTTD